MNYRHQFHAGNFADVLKHVLLVGLIRSLQAKERGILFLDTHAGRGVYDLSRASRGDTLAREPEWPDGIGRLLKHRDVPELVSEYVQLVTGFDRRKGNLAPEPRFYPGSPSIARLLARPQDRLALVEQEPGEAAALRAEFRGVERTSVHEMDGYGAVRAMLPPAERRALVLIDPPYEVQDEFVRIANALRDGLDRLRGGVFAVWYPLTHRARVQEFITAVEALRPPPTLALELTVAGAEAGLSLPGCGLLVINPPWQFDGRARPVLEFLAVTLARGSGAAGRLDWIVPET